MDNQDKRPFGDYISRQSVENIRGRTHSKEFDPLHFNDSYPSRPYYMDQPYSGYHADRPRDTPSRIPQQPPHMGYGGLGDPHFHRESIYSKRSNSDKKLFGRGDKYSGFPPANDRMEGRPFEYYEDEMAWDKDIRIPPRSSDKFTDLRPQGHEEVYPPPGDFQGFPPSGRRRERLHTDENPGNWQFHQHAQRESVYSSKSGRLNLSLLNQRRQEEAGGEARDEPIHNSLKSEGRYSDDNKGKSDKGQLPAAGYKGDKQFEDPFPQHDIFDPFTAVADTGNRKNKVLAGMSFRQQVKFLMQKTQGEANWDMENDSELKASSESSEDENEMVKGYYTHKQMWKASFKRMPPARKDQSLSVDIRGQGSYWIEDNSNEITADSVEPFFIQYEKRMECMRRKMINEQKYRLRMYAYATLQFNPIKQNKFLDRKKNLFTDNHAQYLVCTCQKEKKVSKILDNQKSARKWGSYAKIDHGGQSLNCGASCINRDMSFECSALTCPSQAYCTNRHFQQFQDRLVYPIKTQFKGWGLAAGEFIPKDSFVMQYVGEVFNVDSDIGLKRLKRYKKSTCTYLMRIENNEVIDPTYSGNIARFINHSCDPNCQTRKWTILNEVCVGIFAVKDIQENEELTFDYQFDFFKTPFTRCYCGTAKCKGYLGVATGQDSSSSEIEDSGEFKKSDDEDSIGDLSNVSEKEKIRLQREKNIIMSEVNKERPFCHLCSQEILDTKNILCCKGECKKMFHFDCAAKVDKNVKANSKIKNSRKFTCKDCTKKEEPAVTKKKGRKSNKELQTIINRASSNSLLNAPQPIMSVFQDPEVQKLLVNSSENLLLDRMILLQIRKVEQNILRSMKERVQNIGSRAQGRSKKFNHQQVSDHYTFMFELLRRLKQKIKKITDSECEGASNGPAGCLFLTKKFFKEFPRIAKSQKDVDRIVAEGPDHEYLQNVKENSIDEESEEEDPFSPPSKGKPKRAQKKVKDAEPSKKKKTTRKKIVKEETPKEAPVITMEDLQDEVMEEVLNQATEDVEMKESKGISIPLSMIGQSPDVPAQTVEAKLPNVKPAKKGGRKKADTSKSPAATKAPKKTKSKKATEDKTAEKVEAGKEAVGEKTPETKTEKKQEPKKPKRQSKSKKKEEVAVPAKPDEKEPVEVGAQAASENPEVQAPEPPVKDQEEVQAEDKVMIEEKEPAAEVQDKPIESKPDEETDKQDATDAKSGEEEEPAASEEEEEEEAEVEYIEESQELEQEEDSDSPILSSGSEVIMDSSDSDEAYSNSDRDSHMSSLPVDSEDKQMAESEDKKKRGRPKKTFEERKKQTKQKKNTLSNLFRVNTLNKDQASKEDEESQDEKESRQHIVYEEYRQFKEEIHRRWELFIEADALVRAEHNESERQRQKLNSSAMFVPLETKPSRFNINERVHTLAIKNKMAEVARIEGLQVQWDQPWGGNVTLKIMSSKHQYIQLQELLQFATNTVFQIHNRHRIEQALVQFEIQRIQVPKNFIRKLVGYQEKALIQFKTNPRYQVDFYYNEKLLVDDIFQMDDFTHLRIFGRKQDVSSVSQILMERLESIKMKSILIQKIDCNFLMDNVKEIKSIVDPCEMRIKQNERIWKDLRHPFLFLPNYLRDIILIGTTEEISVAERKLGSFLREKREKYIMNQQLSLLMPIFMKDHIDKIKFTIRKRYQNLQIFHYLPTFPRKHLTVSIIGPWNIVLEAKKYLEELSSSIIVQQYGSYEEFQQTVFHQQIRFTFKSLKRYILEKDIKYLSHWDIVSVFLDNLGKEIQFEIDENDIDMLVKAKESQLQHSKNQSMQSMQPDFGGTILDPLVKPRTVVDKSRNESFLEQLLLPDRQDDSPKADSAIIGQQSQPAVMEPVMDQPQEQPLDVHKIVTEYRENIESMRKKEITQLLKYVREEDPETCINILFVLSQCKTDSDSPSDQKKGKPLEEKDQLETLMNRLDVGKEFLVQCMRTVLFGNLTDFFQSLGKSKHHIKHFESDSSSDDEAKRPQRDYRKRSNSRRRDYSRERYHHGRDYFHQETHRQHKAYSPRGKWDEDYDRKEKEKQAHARATDRPADKRYPDQGGESESHDNRRQRRSAQRYSRSRYREAARPDSRDYVESRYKNSESRDFHRQSSRDRRYYEDRHREERQRDARDDRHNVDRHREERHREERRRQEDHHRQERIGEERGREDRHRDDRHRENRPHEDRSKDERRYDERNRRDDRPREHDRDDRHRQAHRRPEEGEERPKAYNEPARRQSTPRDPGLREYDYGRYPARGPSRHPSRHSSRRRPYQVPEGRREDIHHRPQEPHPEERRGDYRRESRDRYRREDYQKDYREQELRDKGDLRRESRRIEHSRYEQLPRGDRRDLPREERRDERRVDRPRDDRHDDRSRDARRDDRPRDERRDDRRDGHRPRDDRRDDHQRQEGEHDRRKDDRRYYRGDYYRDQQY